LRLFSKQTADIATVKVNLIKLSIAGHGRFVKADVSRDFATSLIMKRAKYNKQNASRKMGWMSF
jgi:hypothetical protein